MKQEYHLEKAEIHTAWLLRPYVEQNKVPDFDNLTYAKRRSEVERLRRAELLRLQNPKTSKHYRQTKKNYAKTNDYIHLTYDERKNFVLDIANCVASWGFARLFAECIDKIHFDPTRAPQTIDEQAFEQVISRFEQYLHAMTTESQCYGLLIHDNNETVAKKHTELMKRFHDSGTLWTRIEHIIETPLFVDSQLTGMVQVADLCAYALRRYLENGDTWLFQQIFRRADRRGNTVIGIRHFTDLSCSCDICSKHRN